MRRHAALRFFEPLRHHGEFWTRRPNGRALWLDYQEPSVRSDRVIALTAPAATVAERVGAREEHLRGRRTKGLFEPVELRDVRMVEPARTCASRSKRASRSGALANVSGRIFSATWQFSVVSVAR